MKDIKISNELLNYVFTDNLQSFKVDKIENNTLYYFWLNEGFYGDESYCKWEKQNINIYEFAFKCKEWAYLQYGIMIQSYLYNGKWRVDILKGIEIDEFFKNIDSEPEAIFLACEYILNNIKQ